MSVTRSMLLLSLLLSACTDEQRSQETERDRVQSQVRAILSAVYGNDADTVLQHTHPKLINLLGGRANARGIVEGALKKLVDSGMKLDDATFPTPPIFLKGADNEFVIVPVKSVIAVKEQRVESLSYQFGARPVGGSDWTYLDGSRIKRENVRVWFPDFPEEYEFPATHMKLLE